MQLSSTVLAIALTFAMPQIAKAAEIEVISGGAFKQVLNALVQQYQTDSGNTVKVTYRTVGQHLKLLKDGEEGFDVAILTPEVIGGLAADGKVVAGSRV